MATGAADSALAASYDARAATYRQFGNGSLLDVVRSVLPPNGSVLDIGCASGGLLAALAGDASRRVGIEISQSAAAAAREVADEVIVGDIADPLLTAGREPFDVVVLADVVEHTPLQGEALRHAARWCRPGGAVVVSVPNIGHWSARVSLARGRWEYAESGIFDRGHLRFFTERSLLDELAMVGLEIESVSPVVPRLRNHVKRVTQLPKPVGTRMERSWQWIGRRRPGLMAFQLIAVARVSDAIGHD